MVSDRFTANYKRLNSTEDSGSTESKNTVLINRFSLDTVKIHTTKWLRLLKFEKSSNFHSSSPTRR